MEMLSEVSEIGPYGGCKYIKTFNGHEEEDKKELKSKDKSQQLSKKQVFAQIEK